MFKLLFLHCLVVFELSDYLFWFLELTFILLFLLFPLYHQLLVLCLKFFDAVLHTLNVQLKLLLYANMLAYVCLQILNKLLVHLRTRRHGICIDRAATLWRLVFQPSLSLDEFDFLNRRSSWWEQIASVTCVLIRRGRNVFWVIVFVFFSCLGLRKSRTLFQVFS